MKRALIIAKFPASMPALFSGLRIAATLAVIGVLVGEMSGGNSDLAYLLTYGGVIAYLAVIAVVEGAAERGFLRVLAGKRR